MNITARTTLASALTLLATAALSPVSATSLPPASINPVFNASLIRCVDSHFSKSLGICGGDALASGHIALTPKATLIKTEGPWLIPSTCMKFTGWPWAIPLPMRYLPVSS